MYIFWFLDFLDTRAHKLLTNWQLYESSQIIALPRLCADCTYILYFQVQQFDVMYSYLIFNATVSIIPLYGTIISDYISVIVYSSKYTKTMVIINQNKNFAELCKSQTFTFLSARFIQKIMINYKKKRKWTNYNFNCSQL